MRRRKIVSSSVVALMISSSMLAACSSNQVTPIASPVEDSGSGPAQYPIKTDKKLTYWSELTRNLVGQKADLQDVPFYQEWQKKTGVPLDFITVPNGQTKEQLNVLIASGDLPDMIETDWSKFPGGPEKAIKDGYILKLNDMIDKLAPNLKKYLEDHPDVDKMLKTDSGSYYAFPFIRGDDSLSVYHGPIIRKDWLDDLNLPVPETIDDWYITLKAFKDKKGAAAPITFVSKPRPLFDMVNGDFVGAWGVTKDFYMDNGQVKYGPMEPGFKDFLATMRKWYSEGLIDRNVATADTKALDTSFANGATGATVGNAGGGIGRWQPIIEAKDPKAVLIGTPYPVLKKGDMPQFGQKDFAYSPIGAVAISATSKNAELAVKMLDYGYSEEGRMFFNFGTEGVSYKMENGSPRYTDLLMKNPDKLSPSQAMSLYIRGNTQGPFVQDKRYVEQYYALQTQRDAIKAWQKTDVAKHKLLPITPTPEESSEYAKIMADVDTLVDEMILKFILGTDSVDSFDQYVSKMKSLKIDRAIEIQKAALERYNKR
ncbi:extracellular solute-binding protein [Paenibacillus sp. YYML68]|uniref:extracellular solute-binding protein n=1 Tax=Paenibacillus sp. YYML68 TaxID=2909250 RepID=UPI0024916724|nr:extracellular solute-binding protein [Paenibacillus sp. YYML68]